MIVLAGLGLLTVSLVGLASTTSAASGSCAVDYRIVNQWPGGFQGAIEITNTGESVDGWVLGFDLPDGQTISNGWIGSFVQSGTTVTVSSRSWNASLGAGATVTPGFIGRFDGANGVPSSFTLNGQRCDDGQPPPTTTAPPTTTLPTTVPSTTAGPSTTVPTTGPSTTIPSTTVGSTTTPSTTVPTTTAPSTTIPGTTIPGTTVAPPTTRPPKPAGPGFRVADGRLLDGNGNDVVLRGINHPHTWYRQQTSAFADIAAAGANSIRVVLSSGQFIENGRTWQKVTEADLQEVIDLCHLNRLVCVLEVHDTVGFGEKQGAVDLDAAVDYWIEMEGVLDGHEDFVIINIGNEPRGNNNAEAWTAETIGAIDRLRNAGFEHTLMVDAPNWGQDWSGTMRDNAERVFTSDRLANTVFSVHMYEVYRDVGAVRRYLESFVGRKLPIVVGEFGQFHNGQEVDEDAILAETQRLGLGWLAWSWSGNSGGTEHLDLTIGFDPDRRSAWGQRLIDGPNGLAETARPIRVFGP